MTLPQKFAWLNKIGLLPNVIDTGLRVFGTQEIVGRGSNKTIIEWRDWLNQNGHKITGYSDDDIPWCGLFVAYVCGVNNKGVIKNPLWARNWAKYGDAVAEKIGVGLTFRKRYEAILGDILVFSRGSGGHVGFYIAEDFGNYFVLGGNQSNRVSIVPVAKSRCLAVRRPPFKYRLPDSAKPYFMSSKGLKVSKDEA